MTFLQNKLTFILARLYIFKLIQAYETLYKYGANIATYYLTRYESYKNELQMPDIMRLIQADLSGI